MRPEPKGPAAAVDVSPFGGEDVGTRSARRTLRVDIDPAAIRANLAEVRRLAPGRRVFAVVKADAYGHGAVAVARALSRTDLPAAARADAFAVVSSGEALEIRDSGVDAPILVLQGPADPDDLCRFVAADLWPVIHDRAQLDWYRRDRRRGELRAWLKVDTGMGRLGVMPGEAGALLAVSGGVRWHGVLSHLARADEADGGNTPEQIRCFAALDLPGALERSLANSAAVIGWPGAHHDWVRPGLMLYGCDPRDPPPAAAGAPNAVVEAPDLAVASASGTAEGASGTVKEPEGPSTRPRRPPLALRPAMRVTTRLLSVKTLAVGAGVGYGQTFRCPETMPVGLAAVGYGDGLPRVLDASARVGLRGADCPVIGRVSMDSIALDLRAVPDAATGDEVELWGPSRPVEALARAAGTIAYELLVGIRGGRRHGDVGADGRGTDVATAR